MSFVQILDSLRSIGAMKVASDSAVKRVLLLIILMFIIPALFTPTWITLYWHLRHGNVVQYRNRKVWVPLRWVAETERPDVRLSRGPVTILGKWSISGVSFSPAHYPPGTSKDEMLRTWESIHWTYAPDGVAVSETQRIMSGVGEAICIKSIPTATTGLAQASCLLVDDGSIAEFVGERKEIDTFFQIIRKMK